MDLCYCSKKFSLYSADTNIQSSLLSPTLYTPANFPLSWTISLQFIFCFYPLALPHPAPLLFTNTHEHLLNGPWLTAWLQLGDAVNSVITTHCLSLTVA